MNTQRVLVNAVVNKRLYFSYNNPLGRKVSIKRLYLYETECNVLKTTDPVNVCLECGGKFAFPPRHEKKNKL